MTASKRNYTALDEQNVTTKPAERKKEKLLLKQKSLSVPSVAES